MSIELQTGIATGPHRFVVSRSEGDVCTFRMDISVHRRAAP
ncbi:MAG: hypothetical protein QOJ74_1256, partial [Ilumatobacteraceae bacterium]|nr:hypothetical protein [Ilumatobacteraceae bacterium]